MQVNNFISKKVLLVDDDKNTRLAISSGLRKEGFLVCEVEGVKKAFIAIRKNRPDVVVLDLSLPDGDGLDLIKEIRKNDTLPVIVCSGRNSENEKVLGLELGADDYITKPLSIKEMASRIRTVLRRGSSLPVQPNNLQLGDISIDSERKEVRKGSILIDLTNKEYDLLYFLVKNPRKEFSREELLNQVWVNKKDRSVATVTEHVRRLRNKLEEDPASPRYLCAVRGIGYRAMP
jgi:two-component system response regulator VicR